MARSPPRSRAAATSRPRCPRPACCAPRRLPPARAEPVDDRARDPAAIGGDRGRDRSRAHDRARRSRRAAARPRGTPATLDAPECRTAFTIASRAASSSGCMPAGRAVAHAHDLDRHAVLGLDLGRELVERGAERTVARRRDRSPSSSQLAQLALLHPREPHDLARVVGAALHERQRLQHGVVQVRGDLGALVGANALAALGDELVHELPQSRDRRSTRSRRARPPRR